MFHFDQYFESGTYNPAALNLFKTNPDQFNKKCLESVKHSAKSTITANEADKKSIDRMTAMILQMSEQEFSDHDALKNKLSQLV
jgi:hypothetical protein